MATQKPPRWTKKKPDYSVAVIRKRFGPKAQIVKMGGGKGWTVKNYDPPGRSGGSDGPGLPGGGTVVNPNLAPRDWVGSEGMIGPWRGKKPPRLDPVAWEWTQNEYGRWFARPRTELTGLNPQQQADIRTADTIANQAEGGITNIYNQAAATTSADNAATSAQITALTGLVGGAQPEGDPTSQALAENARAGQVPGVAATIANIGRQPGVMRAEGAGQAAQFRAGYQAQRAGTIAQYRSDQQAAAAEARAQNLEYIMKLIETNAQNARAELQAQTGLAEAGMQIQGQNQRAVIQADTAAADRAATLRAKIADLNTQLRVARERNQTSRANNITTNLRRLQVEERKARAEAAKQNQANIAKWMERAEQMAVGIERIDPQGRVDDDGKPLRVLVQYTGEEIVRWLMTQGATRRQANQIVATIQQNEGGGTAAFRALPSGPPFTGPIPNYRPWGS